MDGQPLGANVLRLVDAFATLGTPFAADTQTALRRAAQERDALLLQRLLEPHVAVTVTVSTPHRVLSISTPERLTLQQWGYTPLLVKVINEPGVTSALRVTSPHGGLPFAGVAPLSMTRQAQLKFLEGQNLAGTQDRFLHLEMATQQPMTERLSGLGVEYAILLASTSKAGRQTVTLRCDLGEKSEGAETRVTLDMRPAIPVTLSIRDDDGLPTTGRFTFRDRAGHVYPPQARRVAPDLFFQEQIYRHDGEVVLLPPGPLTMTSSRGPEYRLRQRTIHVPQFGESKVEVRHERWVHPRQFGYYSGDHHIHAAGCAHYNSPSEGVLAEDMFRQIKGEGLHVGCVLTWGPCFDFQRQFFSPKVDSRSEPLTLLKYDIEVSGFGSQALGHVCLLNLRDQVYPGSTGTKGWPTWTTPVLRWAKSQGAVTGYAHSASGLQVDARAAGQRLLAEHDTNRDGVLSRAEAERALLPEDMGTLDRDGNGLLSLAEIIAGVDRAADRLPNLAIPELNSVGAQEIFVTTAQGLCDFISAMDTARLPEWNCWYHILNCGFPLKVSGETDFPCMSGTRVGQGRVYVHLGKVDTVDFTAWCEGLRRGRSYVSDGYAHALAFHVGGKSAGDDLRLDAPGKVQVSAKVAFASETPLGIAHGQLAPHGPRLTGDTVNLHGAKPNDEARRRGGLRKVELVVNGQVAASRDVPADDQIHDLSFEVTIPRSSWVALRHFPQMHTNPVTVTVAGKPIRASRASALWCAACIEHLWRVRGGGIHPSERAEAQRTFQAAIQTYRRLANECED